MVRIRQRWNAAALGVVLGLSLVSACKKDDKAGTATGDQTAEKSGGASDDLSLLPADSEVVIAINAAQIRQSALWKQVVEPMVLSGKAQGRLAEFKTKCGFDPASSFSSISIGAKVGGDNPDGVTVLHGMEKSKISPCLDTVKDELTKKGVALTRDGDIWLARFDKMNFSSATTFVNDSTAVTVFGEHADASRVKTVAAGGSTLKSAPAFAEMYKKLKTGDSLWFIANGKALDNLPVKATAVFGSLNVTDGLALDVRIRFEKPEAATEAAAMLNGQAKQAVTYVDKVDITSEGSEVHASIVMSNQKLQSMMSTFGPMLGMMLGLGG